MPTYAPTSYFQPHICPYVCFFNPSEGNAVGEGEEDQLGSGANSSQAHPPSDAGRKIRNAKRKLQGENPVPILIDDLEQVTCYYLFSKRCSS